MKKKFLKILKIIGIVLIAILILLIILILSLRLPTVQNYVKGHMIEYLEDKIKTDVSLGSVYVDFPNNIVMKELYLAGQTEDTLLYAGLLDVGLNIPELLSNTVELTSIDLRQVKANVVRDGTGRFNFDYITEAFVTTDSAATESEPWVISLDKIHLEKIKVDFNDQLNKNHLNVAFNELNTTVEEFDLEANKYGLDQIMLDGLALNMDQGLIQEIAQETEQDIDSINSQNPIQFSLNELAFTNIAVNYADENTRTSGKIMFEELNSEINLLDLGKQHYDIENVLLSNADIDIELYLPTVDVENEVEKVDATPESNNLSVLLNELDLKDVNIKYNNVAIAPQAVGLDYNHLNFKEFNFDLNNFVMQDNNYQGTIASARIIEEDHLNVLALETDFKYGDNESYLKDLLLKTDKTILRDQIVLTYNNFSDLTDNFEQVKILADINNSQVAFDDILNIMPSLRSDPPFNTYPNAVLNLDTKVNGTLQDLVIENIQASGLADLQLSGSGRVLNAMDTDNLSYNFDIDNLSTSSNTIFNLAPKGSIPDNISIPSLLKLSGNVKGTTEVFDIDAVLNSSDGNADIVAKVDISTENAETYAINADVQNLNVGEIIQNKDLGMISGRIIADGTGFDIPTAIADIGGDIQYVDYNGYRYNQMHLDATIDHGAYEILLDAKDSNANLSLRANGIYNEENPTIQMAGNIQKLDLNKLNFYGEPLVLSGNINGEFTNLNPDNLNGKFTLTNLSIANDNESYALDEVDFKATSEANYNSIVLNSPVADLDISGDYKLSQIMPAMMQTFNNYYHFQDDTNIHEHITENQYVDFKLTLKDDQLLSSFVPDLKSFEPIVVEGKYVADSELIELKADIPEFIYMGYTIHDGSLNLETENQAIVYDLNVATVANESLQLDHIELDGSIANDIISFNLEMLDDVGVDRYLIAGNIGTEDNRMTVNLDSNGLILNYENWQVGEDNLLSIYNSGDISAQNFEISNGNSSLDIHSSNDDPKSPLIIGITDFDIATISAIIQKDELPASGIINGTASINNPTSDLIFTSDITITDFNLYEQFIGDVQAQVISEDSQIIEIHVVLNENGAKIDGTYGLTNDELDFVADLNNLEVDKLVAFSLGEVKNGEGNLSGKVTIGGTVDAPKVLGTIDLNNVGFTITQIGSDFKNINDEIQFTSNGIVFDQFFINDSKGNVLLLDGIIETTDYSDYGFDLTVDAENFRVVDSEKDLDQIMYGILAVNTNLRIKGDLDLPVVDGSIAVSDDTEFTFVVPQDAPTLEEREGIVEFVDRDQVAMQPTMQQDSISTQSDIKGMDVNVEISITREASISMIIDKATGDFVELKGDGELTGGIDASGKTTLVGVYEVHDGGYELNVSFLKRRFDIQEGSTITWNGEPLEATLDMTAIYKTKAAPIDLLQQQLNGLAPSEYNMYKQQIDFNTILNMDGDLMKPIITFDIQLEEENTSVATSVIENTETKLEQIRQDESELNKQVFAILLLNRFVGENPFQSEAGVSAGTMARQSVSQILSQQLNNLASDLIGGVNLEFGFDSYEDFSQGSKNTRTDLNVGLSKRLLNDRLKITVGSKFGLEGAARENEELTNIAGDLNVEYALSKNGRYLLRAYRTNEYEVALQGQVIETGLGFVITLEYDEFQDIFKKPEESQEKK